MPESLSDILQHTDVRVLRDPESATGASLVCIVLTSSESELMAERIAGQYEQRLTNAGAEIDLAF